MHIYENMDFRRRGFADCDSGAVFQGFRFRHCYFESYGLSATDNPALRSTIRDVQLEQCAQRGCTVYPAIVENVMVDGLRTHGQLLQAFGAVFRHVTLRGRIDRLMLNNDICPDPLASKAVRDRQTALFREANADYYREVDWALDISEGEFRELDIRDIPAGLIRRDPETQIVVTRQRVLKEHWRELGFRMPVTPFSLDFLLQRESQDMVLIAPKRHPKFREYLEDLRMLRSAGIAEPD